MTDVKDDFPYNVTDIIAWVVRKKDGTAVRYQLQDPGTPTKPVSVLPAHYQKSLSAWCEHNPTPEPVFSTDQVQLFIADAAGARAHSKEFDVCIDGGNVLSTFEIDPTPVLKGDQELKDLLLPYQWREYSGPRILQISWTDRAAPPLWPHFWPVLAQKLTEAGKEKPIRVLTICQGGHGRSGTSLVALMMCYTDYSPLDAITHLRAVHCPRAIESVTQHQYLNWLGKILNRPENALESEQVKDFKARFLELASPYAKPYQERLLAASKTTDEVKRD